MSSEPKLVRVLHMLEREGHCLRENLKEVFQQTEPSVTIFISCHLPCLEDKDYQSVEEESREIGDIIVEEEVISKISQYFGDEGSKFLEQKIGNPNRARR